MQKFAIYILAVLVVAGCSTKPKVVKTDPYIVPEDEFKKSVNIIATAPVTIIEGLPDATPVIDNFDALIENRLRNYGYTILEPKEYKTVWERVVAQMGGITDPETGLRDPVKLTRAMFATLDSLKVDFELDAVLIPDIVVVEAEFAAGNAVWDGASQRIESGGPLSSVFSGSQRGVVGALSLTISIRGEDGTELYANAGGIETLSRISGKEFINVPRQELFADEKRNKKAVEIALKPLKR
jgi:hypothetical protein